MNDVPNPFRDGLTRSDAPAPCVFVLFGATGDLTARKLVPALWQLVRGGLAPKQFFVLGVARRAKSDDEFRAEMRAAVDKFGRDRPADEAEWEAFAQRLGYCVCEFTQPAAYQALAQRLRGIDASHGTAGNRLYYLAVAPEFFEGITSSLHEAELIGPDQAGGWRRVVIEKPFGTDLASAARLSGHLHGLLTEDQIYRIDHYLGKETVQNLLTLRFGNAIFEPLWNRNHIEHVQITVAETEGIGRRGEFYDQTGALRDMVQNHMMQLLALVAMEPPVTWEAGAIRDEKAKVLRALPAWTPAQVASRVVRAQYTRGTLAGVEMPGFTEEAGIAPDSLTESYVAMRLTLDTWRWSGVPFYLRHGKRLPKRTTEIAIAFHQPPLSLFPPTVGRSGNTLVMRIQPDEGISLNFVAKVPGTRLTLQAVKMDFGYGSSFAQTSPEAYERLLLDAMLGDNTLFTREDEVASAWRFVDSVRAGLAEQPRDTMAGYAVGSWGPAAADALLDGDATWRRL
ncbi:MAG: glucose-6-phosphate dehydrogenase [Armatimonadetes bacterium]|nr:glucose-6-phosphate dehydrogenase [Armatimonadota bacterium]